MYRFPEHSNGRLFCHIGSPRSIMIWIRIWLGWLVDFCLSSKLLNRYTSSPFHNTYSATRPLHAALPCASCKTKLRLVVLEADPLTSFISSRSAATTVHGSPCKSVSLTPRTVWPRRTPSARPSWPRTQCV